MVREYPYFPVLVSQLHNQTCFRILWLLKIVLSWSNVFPDKRNVINKLFFWTTFLCFYLFSVRKRVGCGPRFFSSMNITLNANSVVLKPYWIRLISLGSRQNDSSSHQIVHVRGPSVFRSFRHIDGTLKSIKHNTTILF